MQSVSAAGSRSLAARVTSIGSSGVSKRRPQTRPFGISSGEVAAAHLAFDLQLRFSLQMTRREFKTLALHQMEIVRSCSTLCLATRAAESLCRRQEERSSWGCKGTLVYSTLHNRCRPRAFGVHVVTGRPHVRNETRALPQCVRGCFCRVASRPAQ
jgi:hypothetical protein